MTSQPLIPRKGSTLDHAGVVGANGEISVDVTKHTVVVHDGETLGGFPLALEGALPAGVIVGTGLSAIVRLTQEEYDALVEPDFNTLYVIVPAAIEMVSGSYGVTGYDVNLILLP